MSVSAWEERRAWWLSLLIIVVVSVLLLLFYRAALSDDVRGVGRQLENRRSQLAGLEESVQRKQDLLGQIAVNSAAVDSFYDSSLAPPSERLTEVIREIRALAGMAGLSPRAISYPEDDLEDFGLTRRRVSFSVEGSFLDLRRFINLLELSDAFLTLEEVRLSGRGNASTLRIALRLSTLFRDEAPAAEIAEGESAS